MASPLSWKIIGGLYSGKFCFVFFQPFAVIPVSNPLCYENVHMEGMSLPPVNEVWGKVIFLYLSVILFTGGVPGQVPPGQVHPLAGTPPRRYTPLAGTSPSRYPTSLIRYPPGRYTPWQAVHAGIWSTSGWYTSYWNTFLFSD